MGATKEPMILLDAMMQLYKANYSLSDLVTKDGRPTGMEYGFLKSLEALKTFFKDEIILCWEGRRNFRYNIDPDYKISRRDKRKKEAHKFLTPKRVEGFRNLLSMVAENAFDDELEGDDVIATLTERYCKTEKVVIYSNDHDLHQLIRGEPHRVVQVKEYQKRFNPWSVWRIREKYHGLYPKQLAIYFAITGCKGDDVIGAGRVRGPMVAAAIRDGYSGRDMPNFELFSCGEILALEKFFDSGQFERNLKLVTLRIKDDLKVVGRNWQPRLIKKWLEGMEFRTLKLCKECNVKMRITEDEPF